MLKHRKNAKLCKTQRFNLASVAKYVSNNEISMINFPLVTAYLFLHMTVQVLYRPF